MTTKTTHTDKPRPTHPRYLDTVYVRLLCAALSRGDLNAEEAAREADAALAEVEARFPNVE